MAKKIAIVIPVYREAKSLQSLYQRLELVTSRFTKYSWEYIFINDGSPDNSYEVLVALAVKDPKIKVLDLSRNFGKEIALTAGVHEATSCDAVICIDADLQHPPELIPRLVYAWEEGAEVVVTVRTSTDREPLLRRWGSSIFYWLINKVSSFEMIPKATDFRLYDQKVVLAFERATERERLFRGIMDWMGFRRVMLEFKADAREHGEAGYSYVKLWSLAINSITSFSLWPLRLTGYLGVLITSGSGLLLLWMVGNNLLTSKTLYTPLAIVVVVNTFLIGIVLMAVGLVALYIGTIHTEVINRPLYLIREKINFESL
ncbi:glycosyltransferase family 2 protein [Polynucleobacter sp. es-EL-1]|uniref:glycosyltransferase family 2 protein n=1 Tax=Polynucleobacter sp. es-EL-1 TaxID=1855652 RepID=UPI001BFDA136|nr:glycosyltransferase family 2 protein [Polynucleobacter sp. es-EL-1]